MTGFVPNNGKLTCEHVALSTFLQPYITSAFLHLDCAHCTYQHIHVTLSVFLHGDVHVTLNTFLHCDVHVAFRMSCTGMFMSHLDHSHALTAWRQLMVKPDICYICKLCSLNK